MLRRSQWMCGTIIKRKRERELSTDVRTTLRCSQHKAKYKKRKKGKKKRKETKRKRKEKYYP